MAELKILAPGLSIFSVVLWPRNFDNLTIKSVSEGKKLHLPLIQPIYSRHQNAGFGTFLYPWLGERIMLPNTSILQGRSISCTLSSRPTIWGLIMKSKIPWCKETVSVTLVWFGRNYTDLDVAHLLSHLHWRLAEKECCGLGDILELSSSLFWAETFMFESKLI